MIQRSTKKHQTHNPIQQQDLLPKPLQAGMVFCDKFKLLEKVGQGSFGSIYKTENLDNGEICATKFEKREKNGISLLVREIKVLLEVKKLNGFPQLIFYGRDEQHNYFMQSYLGYNLEYLLRKTKSFSQLTCLKLSLQLLERLEALHKKNLLHRDLKPENICIGWYDIDVLYLIDFGLSKYFVDSKGDHIQQTDKKGIIGTARYASIAAHLGKEQSRKDDLESLAYVLIYLCKGKLPWMNIQILDKIAKYQKILEIKQQIAPEKLCENLPKCYYSLIQYSKSREFTEEPNYQFLKDQFIKAIQEKEASEPFQEFDWERLPELKTKASRKKRKSPERIQGTMIRKSQISFLNVPELEDQQGKKSRGYMSHNSYGTTKMINYQISQLGGEVDNYRKYVTQVSKRKDSKSQTVVAPKDVRKSTFFNKPIVEQQQMVDDDYVIFDDIDQIADDETNITFRNIEIKPKYFIYNL